MNGPRQNHVQQNPEKLLLSIGVVSYGCENWNSKARLVKRSLGKPNYLGLSQTGPAHDPYIHLQTNPICPPNHIATDTKKPMNDYPQVFKKTTVLKPPFCVPKQQLGIGHWRESAWVQILQLLPTSWLTEFSESQFLHMQNGLIIYWVEYHPPKIQVHPEPVNVTLIGNRLFEDVNKMRSYSIRVGPKSNMTGVIMRRNKSGPKHRHMKEKWPLKKDAEIGVMLMLP